MAHAWEFDVRAALPRSVADVGVDARRSVLGKVSQDVMRAIIAVWPVDTGRSLAGFRREPSGTSWIVYNDVSYTKYVHSGLATRTAIKATRAARSTVRAELAAILKRQQTVGARGTFQLRRRVPLPSPALVAPPARQARAVRSALAVVAQVAEEGPAGLLAASTARAQVQAGNILEASASLAERGFVRAARAVRAIGRRSGLATAARADSVRTLRLSGRAHEAQILRRAHAR